MPVDRLPYGGRVPKGRLTEVGPLPDTFKGMKEHPSADYLKRTEAMVVRYECRDGSQRMWISPIVRPKTGGVALGDALEMGETVEGRFASLF